MIYSGSGGFPTLSLGIPRLLYSIILSTLFDYKLEEAVVYPLLYAQPLSADMFRYGYPYVSDIVVIHVQTQYVHGNLTSFGRGLVQRSQYGKHVHKSGRSLMEVPSHFADAIAAISRRNGKPLFHV